LHGDRLLVAAAEHFQRAQSLGKDNVAIQQSEILKKHLKM